MKALITGGSRGIGKATAILFQEKGYQVYAPTSHELDMASADSINTYCEMHKNDNFDVLINNAGINDIYPIDEITEEALTRTMDVNLMGPIRLIRGIVQNMKKQCYGRIINIGSIWGLAGKPGRVAYAATKHGIHGITQTLAVELAPYNILVNTICPGFTLTDLTIKNNSSEQINEISSFIPLQRMAKPEEVAKAIYFLAGQENTYITGQQLAVDGGYTAK